MKPKAITSTMSRQQGFTMIEVAAASVIAVGISAMIALSLADANRARQRAADAAQMAQYINGVAAYMSAQGSVAPATLIRNGTDWLKSVDCGGLQPADNFYLPCNIPTDFNNDNGIGAPRVTFDWGQPRAPSADIQFGQILNDAGEPDPPTAAVFVEEINARLDTDGYQFAEAFIVDPAIADGATASAELQQANLRAFVDMAIESTTFVRLDGNSIMRGALINENDTWAIISRDENGVENAEPADPTASINTNDVYVRSVDAWTSETHELAEEAYRIAARAPIFVSNVRSGTTISKPTCPAPLVDRISAVPAGFVGGPTPTDPRFIAGARTRVIDNTTSYTVWLDILYDGEASFQTVAAPPDPQNTMGLINVTVKCSDA
ncbi:MULTISPECIES: prepilin-type N-terminal cleavage/methylation domain-containing protein [Marinobacter]|nr:MULTISPECIES: prepilin-type N-terminal cleavage/methylation domain-containing protein [Marinobacter]